MKKTRTTLPLSALLLNEGQLDWLPRNPRTWTKEDVERTAKSIAEDPDFLEDRPVLAIPFQEGKYIVFGGNLRREGSKAAGRKDVPAVVYVPESDDDRTTILRRAMKDNGSFGSWDYDALANEWDDLPLADFGIPVWDFPHEQGDKGETVNPEQFGETFTLPDGEKEGFRQVSFQLPDEMAEVLLLAVKAAGYTDEFLEITDGEEVNANGVGAYILAKEWLDGLHLDPGDYDEARKDVEELRAYLRDALKESGRKAADIDAHLGTNGMAGHYLGASQWMFPTKAAYEKLKEIMPLPRDFFECKKKEIRFRLVETLGNFEKKWEELKK